MLTMTGGFYYADLIIFGFANGTDSIIDISPYLMDSFNYNKDLNIIQEMYNNIKIDNNIFGYVKVEQIKIVSVPEQIKFYKGKDANKELINDGEIVNKNIENSLFQIKELIKEEIYYELYYQGFVKELDYDNFYGNNPHKIDTYSQNNNGFNDYKNNFNSHIFNG